jgi:ankyrin repeat protein
MSDAGSYGPDARAPEDEAPWEKGPRRARRRTVLIAIVAVLLCTVGGALLAPHTGMARRALSRAAREGRLRTVRRLAALGVPVDTVGEMGWTPLHWSARMGWEEGVCELLELGAPVDAADTVGFTPLMCASVGGHVGVVRCLLRAGADPDATSIQGEVPSDCMHMWWPTAQAVAPRYMVHMSGTATPLIIAAEGGYGDVLRMLVEAGAEAGVSYALRRACADNSMEMMRILLSRDLAGRRYPDLACVAAVAARAGSLTGLDLLAEHGFRVATPECRDWVVLAAAGRGHASLLELLFARGVSSSAEATAKALREAVAEDFVGVAQLLLEHGGDPNATDQGRALIHLAPSSRMVAVLLDAGAQVDAVEALDLRYQPPGEGPGRTRLHMAAARGEEEVAELLLAAGADPQLEDAEGSDALDIAAYGGESAIVDMIRSHSHPGGEPG